MKTAVYLWRVMMKAFCFAVFGIGSLLFGMLIFPPIIFFVRSSERSDRMMRRTIQAAFSGFTGLMRALGLIRVRWDGDLETATRGGGLIVANHPSLIDIVILMSRVRNADCIVKKSLFRFPLVGMVVRKLYISNELQGDRLVEACSRSLRIGNTLIIFPEGTRTAGGSRIGAMKRGAARIALANGIDTLPIYIDTPDATGLRKGDRMTAFRRGGPIDFRMAIRPTIPIAPYTGMSQAIGARQLTDHYRRQIGGTSPE